MFQHHIQLRTPEQLGSEDALNWYKVVEQFGPENVIYNRQKGDHFVALEYGVDETSEFPHVYIVTLTRDMTAEEAQFVVQAWDYLYDGDCDIELSSNFDAGLLAQDIDNNIISIDEEVKQQAITEMKKWRHNRWYQQKIAEGWRYGGYFNSREKTHPALRDWDQLSESHRRSPEFSDIEILEWIHKNKR